MYQSKTSSFTITTCLNNLVVIALFLFAMNSATAQENASTNDTWKKMHEILQNLKSPSFPNKTFNIVDYGAKPNSSFDNSSIINKVIQDCSKKGEGVVLVPKGKSLSSAIHLDNNVNLHLEEGAEIIFSTNPNDYLPLVHTTFEGTECMNYSPLIYAYQKTAVILIL